MAALPGTRYSPQAALIVVDVQNDFADPAGSLYVQGAERILALVNSEARLATEAGAFVVYGDPLGSTPLLAAAHALAFVLVVVAAWRLAPAQAQLVD